MNGRYEQLRQAVAGTKAKLVGKAALAAALVLTPTAACSSDNEPKFSGTLAAVESCDTSAPMPAPIADLYNAPDKAVETNARARIQNKLCRIALSAAANIVNNKHEDDQRVENFDIKKNDYHTDASELRQNLSRYNGSNSWDFWHNSATFSNAADGTPDLAKLTSVSTTHSNADGVTSIYKGNEWSAVTYAMDAKNPATTIVIHYPPLPHTSESGKINKYDWDVMPDQVDFVGGQFGVDPS